MIRPMIAHATLSRRTWLAGAAAMFAPVAACRAAVAASAADYGARGDGIADDTRALQAALDAEATLRLDGRYRITDALRLRSGQTVELSAGTVVRQYRIGRPAFIAERAGGVRIRLNGGSIQGPGGWSPNWTGNQGWEGLRGVRFVGCTDCSIAGPGRVAGWGNAAIDITGGSGIACTDLDIEGTHRLGQPLRREDNFQNGIYISNDVRAGPADALTVAQCRFSGMAQGILREAQRGASVPTRLSTIRDCDFLDIPGQHGIYNQDGALNVQNCRFTDVALSALKSQAADAGRVLRNISATGIVAERVGNAVFEVAEVGGFGGGIDGAVLDGEGSSVGFLVTINGRITNSRISVKGTGISANAVFAQGRGIRAVAVTVDATDVGQDGVLVIAPDAELTVTPTIRQANSTRTMGGSGVRVSSRGARVTLLNPRLTDSRKRMMYGLFSDTAGSEVRVRGAIVATGASDTAVRATGRIVEFPASATLEGARGRITGQQNIAGQPK